MKRLPVFLFLALLAGAALSATSSNYILSPQQLLSGGGTAEGTSYSTVNSISGQVSGTTSGSAYSTSLGFIYATVSYSTAEGGTGSGTAPRISNIQFDGRTIVNNDYVNNDVTITALVSDAASGINTATSSIEIASVQTSFANLSGNSSYNSTSGLLTYKHASVLTNTTYTFTIYARNNAGELTSQTVSFQVNSGELSAASVLSYPNPFNPNNGTLEITYKLNKDGAVAVYIFNTLGQLVWKQNYASGASGGAAGYNTVSWNGVNSFGQTLSNDVYLCRIVSGGKVIGGCKIAVIK